MDWDLRLNDAMSGPAARAAAALKPVEDKLRDVNRQLASQAIDKMNDGLKKQQAQLRLQRTELAANARAAKAQEREDRRMDAAAARARAASAQEEKARAREAAARARVEAKARAASMREDRIKARAAESQARTEARAKASAERYFQQQAQQRQRLEERVRARQARALAVSARQEQAVQRTKAREQERAWAALQRQQSASVEGQRSEVMGMLPGKAGALMAIAAAALAAATAVAALGAAFARAVVDAIAFREAAIGGLTQVMKNATSARQVFDVGVSLAARWNLDPREAVTQLQDLVSKGFSAQDARVLLTASADLKVMNPNANIGNIMLAIGQIKSKGVLQMEELQGQLAEAGINVGKTLEIIGKRLGKSTADVRKMISAGKIDSNTGIWAIVKSIEEMGGGKLGSVADKASKSISSMMAGLKFRPGLLGLKLAELLEGGPGEAAVRRGLQKLLLATDPEKSPGMKKLMAGAASLANELLQLIFGPLAAAGSGGGMQAFLDRAAQALQGLAAIVRTVRPVVHALFAGLSTGARQVFDVFATVSKLFGGALPGDLSSVASAARLFGQALALAVGIAAALAFAVIQASATFMGMVAAVGALPSALLAALTAARVAVVSFASDLFSAGSSAGSNLWQGMVQGIESGITAITDAGTRLANAAKSAVAGALSIQSPSRVMMEMGGYTAAGFAQGVDGGAGQVDTAMRDMVAPPPAPVLGQGGAVTSNTLAAGGITVNVVLQGEAGAQPGAVGSEVRAAVADALEQLLAQMGLSPTPT